MNWLLRLLFPAPLYFGGGGGGDSGAQQQADEARKSALRSKIDAMYGIGPNGARPAVQTTTSSGALGRRAMDEAAREQATQAGETFDANASVASDAAKQMEAERKQVSDATRGYYTDQLTRAFGGAERNNRFALARQGLMGGSQDVDSNASLQTDENLGATRIDQASRAAAASLDQQREQERLNAIGLVNSGAGESAVAAAQAGLRNSLENVSTANRASLFNDLFTGGADAYSAQAQQNALLSAQLGIYTPRLAAFFNNNRTSSGTISPSGGGSGGT